MSRVFYAPAPYPPDEDARQRVVDALLARDLDMSRLKQFVDSAAQLFGTEIGALTILDGERQWIAAASGIDTGSTPRTIAFCGYTIRESEGFSVLDATRDERFAGHPLVREGIAVRFYAGAPLIVQGAAIGALCAVDSHSRTATAPLEFAQLRKLAALASGILEEMLTPEPTMAP